MGDPKTEAGRISELIAMHRKDAETFDKMGKPRKAHDDLRHAKTLERFALPLALEVDRLRALIGFDDVAKVIRGRVDGAGMSYEHEEDGRHMPATAVLSSEDEQVAGVVICSEAVLLVREFRRPSETREASGG